MGTHLSVHSYSNTDSTTAEVCDEFARFAKTDDRPTMAVEHQTYDYAQNEEEQNNETYAIISCPHSIGFSSDKIAIIDLDPISETFCQIVDELFFPSIGDEPGRMNWERSAEKFSDMSRIHRDHLIVPCMNSNQIYILSVEKRRLKIEKIIKSDELYRRDMSCPYSVRSLPLKGAPIHISTLGDRNGHGKGDFLLVDRRTWETRTKSEPTFVSLGGEFAFQPRHNVLISCEFGHPRLFRDELTSNDLENVSEKFGTCLHVWQISPPHLLQTIELEPIDGSLVTMIRFLHNTDCNHAFACSAIGSSIFHLHMSTISKKWVADQVAHIPNLKVEDWISNEVPAFLTDIVISMDDRWMYVCGYLHGVVWRFDIQDPFRVSLFDKINIGGIIVNNPQIKLRSLNAMENRWWLPPETRSMPRGTRFRGGPGLMQLSKNGRRLFVCNSFYKPWDAQFYPTLISDGGQMAQIDIFDERMVLNEQFLVDMKDSQKGPFVIRDIRFFDGDSTSDTFL